jgi:5-methylcytosine-specific restriction endonuclease McrA
VEVVSYSLDKTIQGVNRTWPLPSVVRVLSHFKRERIRVKFSRLNIYTRDNFRCQYCGVRFPTEQLTFDHVIPRSKGGKTTWDNIVTSCARCNHDLKSNRTLAEAGMKLLRKPVKPRYLPAVSVKMDMRTIPSDWIPYWTTVLDA